MATTKIRADLQQILTCDMIFPEVLTAVKLQLSDNSFQVLSFSDTPSEIVRIRKGAQIDIIRANESCTHMLEAELR